MPETGSCHQLIVRQNRNFCYVQLFLKQSGDGLHPMCVRNPNQTSEKSLDELLPNIDAIRQDSIRAGGSDPLSLRFRVVEYERATGDFVRVLLENSGFLEAIENTTRLIAGSNASHFCLEPVGFLQ